MTTAIAATLAAVQAAPGLGAEELTAMQLVIFWTIFVVASIALLRVHRSAVNTVWPQPESHRPAFTPMDVGLVLLGYFWMMLLVSLVLGMVAPEGKELGLGLTLGASVAVQGGTCLMIYGLVWRRASAHAALGLRRGRTGSALALGATHYVGYAPFLVLALFLSPTLLEIFLGRPPEMQDVAVMIREAASSERLLVAIAAVIVIPFLEEFMFRGFLQNALEGPLGRVGAVVLSSAAFALLHGVDAAIPIFVLSLVLGAVMLRTRRLVACWFVHGLHNGLTTALLFFGPSDLTSGP